MPNLVKGFNIDGTVYKYDYQALENKPVSLPSVTYLDENKFLRVNSSGEWVAAVVPSAEEASF